MALKMLDLLLVVTVGCVLPQAFSQDPLCRLPIRSDASSNNQYCDDSRDNADEIRDEIYDDVFNLLSEKFYGLVRDAPGDNCAAIQARFPDATSDWYWVIDTDEEPIRVWCNMELACGPNNVTGWTRVAYVDMSNPEMICPGSNFVEVTSPIRYCRRSSTGYACDQHNFDEVNVEYSRVCGRVTGIQIGTGDVFRSINEINLPYVDGVSLTYGDPRQHIWTFLSYTSEFFNDCPCSTGSTRIPPDFVGQNYFCESGANTRNVGGTDAFTDDPLWDGQLCRETEVPCCDRPPWFYRDFGSQVSDTIDFRLCSDQGSDDEESAFQLVELYVQ